MSIIKYTREFMLKIRTKFIQFRQSLLFYPSLFTLAAIILFQITSTIDEKVFSDKSTIDIPFFQNLLFSGSPNAARNILGTIASGWATILGVAYSVTLLTLQLSTSKYTSHIIKRFEQDKINQLTLGWFIFVVTYSLLVLKTVRTEELTGLLYNFLNNTISTESSTTMINQIPESFAPILGVNISITISITGLFIFVVFLKNISNYLRPMILTHKISKQISNIVKSYDDRILKEENLEEIKKNKVADIRSNTTGVITNIDWKKLNRQLFQSLGNKKTTKESQMQIKENRKYLVDFKKGLGEKVYEGDVLATIYKEKIDGRAPLTTHLPYDDVDLYDHYPSSSSSSPSPSPSSYSLSRMDGSKENANDAPTSDKKSSDNMHKNEKDDLQSKVVVNVRISNERDLNVDPFYGIDLLRSIAIKAIDSKDIDMVGSCVLALFDVLLYGIIHEDKMGRPFSFLQKETTRNHLQKKNKDKSLSEEYKVNTSNTASKETDDIPKEKTINFNSLSIIINPDETSITEMILTELSVISSTATDNSNIHIFNQIITSYITLGRKMSELGQFDTFNKITEWLSGLCDMMSNSVSYKLQEIYIYRPLNDFRKELMTLDNNLFLSASFSVFIDPLIEKHRLAGSAT